jgi:hypothetical protein
VGLPAPAPADSSHHRSLLILQSPSSSSQALQLIRNHQNNDYQLCTKNITLTTPPSKHIIMPCLLSFLHRLSCHLPTQSISQCLLEHPLQVIAFIVSQFPATSITRAHVASLLQDSTCVYHQGALMWLSRKMAHAANEPLSPLPDRYIRTCYVTDVPTGPCRYRLICHL